MELLQSKTWKNFLIFCFIFDQIFAYPKNDICLTKGCVKAASGVIDAMDTTVDPCDNFYNFACGNYIKNSNLVDEYDGDAVIGNLRVKVDEQLRTIVSEAINRNDTKPFKLVKTFYSQCMNKIGTTGSFLDFLERFGGWPILKGENWNKNQFKFSDFILEIQKYQTDNYLFDLTIRYNRWIYLSRTLPKTNLYSDEYRNYMKDFIALFGSDKHGKPADFEAELDEILNFEKKIEEIPEDISENKNDTIKYENVILKKLKQFQNQNDYLNWKDQISQIKPNVEENQRILVTSPNYFTRLGELIKSTSQRTLANYLMLNFAKTSSNYLTNYIQNLNETYTKQASSGWSFCLAQVKSYLQHPLSAMYIEKHFGTQVKANIKEMAKAIRTEAVYTFEAAEWMNETIQTELLQKLDEVTIKYVGFLNELMDSVKMKKKYENFNLKSDRFLISLKLKENKYKEQYMQNVYRRAPYVVNAFYDPSDHSMNFPAAFLQSPMYDSNQPQYMNYGAMGWVIGHELSHMFRDGTKYLGKDRVNCLINQYSSYVEKSINQTLNGAITITEDIADNIGVKLAYGTYINYINYVGDELKLPGLNYTPEQLFWIAGAQQWCTNRGVGKTKKLMSDVHTLPAWRVFGTFRNMVEFSEDFQCSENTKMNPKRRCEIWQ